jgi:hypothetical protein
MRGNQGTVEDQVVLKVGKNTIANSDFEMGA